MLSYELVPFDSVLDHFQFGLARGSITGELSLSLKVDESAHGELELVPFDSVLEYSYRGLPGSTYRGQPWESSYFALGEPSQ